MLILCEKFIFQGYECTLNSLILTSQEWISLGFVYAYVGYVANLDVRFAYDKYSAAGSCGGIKIEGMKNT